MVLEHSENVEQRSFSTTELTDRAGLNLAVQCLYQPLGTFNSLQDLRALDFGTGTDLYGSAAFTSEKLSASSLMADEPGQKLDAPKIHPLDDPLQKRSAEKALIASTIGSDTVTDATTATTGERSVERVLSTIRLGQPTPAFEQDVQSALRSLPKQLKEALLPYQIYTSQIPEEFINECRNHPGVSIKEVEERNNVRGHFALTDTENHLQGFSEWHKNPTAGRLVHISEIANVRSTIFHEAEHALDAKLGHPSSNDPEFERRYQLGLARVRSQALTEDERNFISIFAPPKGSDEEEFNYSKSEAMAEFGAYFHTGSMGNRLIPAQRVLALFPELAQYVNQKVQAGEW